MNSGLFEYTYMSRSRHIYLDLPIDLDLSI